MSPSQQARRVWKLLFLIACVALSPRAAEKARAAPAPARRNVLLLIADDQGLDAGCYGNPAVRTPNLDRLAAEGVRFTHAFATVASCSASRSVILTGLHNHTNGQFGHAHGENNQHTYSQVRSLPKLLGDNGYRTGIIGKYHVKPREVYPFQWEVFSGIQGSRGVYEMAEKAREFFTADDPRPFFLLVGYSDPHRARVGFANDRRYTGIENVVYKPEDVRVPYFLPDEPEVRQELAEYYQAVSRLDQGLGLVLSALEKSGKEEETLVMYVSDNGIAFPGAKTNLYDPGIHLPMVVRSPIQQKQGVVNRAMVSWVDITPTILDWTGVGLPESVAGRSVLPILEREESEGWDSVYASHTFHEITMYYPMRAIRTRRYKYIWNIAHQLPYPHASDLWASPTWQGILARADGRMGRRSVDAYLHRPEHELYDLENDPHELNNVADDPAYGAILADLRARLRRMQEETHDPWVVKYRY